MSMIGYFFLATDAELREAESAPDAVERLIDAAYEGRKDDLVDVDKAWHCLHFLLTGTASEGEPPMDFVVRGGTEVGEDMGTAPREPSAAPSCAGSPTRSTSSSTVTS